MRLALLMVLFTNACSGVALNTRVADVPASRAAIAASVIPGTTTETALVTRWGQPTQKIRDGAQTEFVYRNMWNPKGAFPIPNFGDSANYVIVTFQYGIATGVRISDEIDCRATFAPRPPNYTFDNLTEVRLVGACAPEYPPGFFAPGGALSSAVASVTGGSGQDAGSADQMVLSDDGVAPGGKSAPAK